MYEDEPEMLDSEINGDLRHISKRKAVELMLQILQLFGALLILNEIKFI